jgi:N-alpha-acetyltransferase 15/16, NatA auxiliary subunit
LPRAHAPKRLLLNYTDGSKFKHYVNIVLKQNLLKGVPSLFSNLSGLYTNPEKVKIIEELLLLHKESLNSTMCFYSLDKMHVSEETASSSEAQIEEMAKSTEEETDPTVYLWILAYLAQHYQKLNDLPTALRYIQEVFICFFIFWIILLVVYRPLSILLLCLSC